MLPEALWLPLGPRPAAALRHLVTLGVLAPERVLEGMPHPSGANAERIKFFLGLKPRGEAIAEDPSGLDRVGAGSVARADRAAAECMTMAISITRQNPRTGKIERPWRNRDGVFVLGDPAHGALKHHDKFAVKVAAIEEVAALVARGFSVRMTDGECPPSLISPDSSFSRRSRTLAPSRSSQKPLPGRRSPRKR